MTTLSQQNLLALARQNAARGDLDRAIENAEEALQGGASSEVVTQLCALYLKNDEAYAAYALIKEERDLFSNQEILAVYKKVLQANHFVIEALEVANLSRQEIAIAVAPLAKERQQAIMSAFRQKVQPTQQDYQQLLKLDLTTFENFAQSLLLDPSLNFAVRIALCEDLTRLGISDRIKVMVLGVQEEFIPAQSSLLKQNPVYREVVSGIGSRYYHRPSQLPAVLGEVNLILGSLYPKIGRYVDEPDSFARDIASYVEKGDGRGNHALFKAIDAHLPK